MFFNGKSRKVFGISSEVSVYQIIFNTCFYESEMGICQCHGGLVAKVSCFNPDSLGSILGIAKIS